MRNMLGRSALAVSAVLLVQLTAVRPAQAQFGIMGGANFESLTDLTGGPNPQLFSAATGYHVGIFAELGLGPVSIRPAALYLNAGSLFQGAQFLTTDAFDLSYLAVPIDIQLHLIPFVYFLAGPEFQFLLSAKTDPDFKDNLKNLVMRGGAGLGFKLGPVFAEGRYVFGLTGLTPSDPYTVGPFTITSGDQVSNAVRLSVGLGF
jgi:Outer membrane protein beta-barrel domain